MRIFCRTVTAIVRDVCGVKLVDYIPDLMRIYCLKEIDGYLVIRNRVY